MPWTLMDLSKDRPQCSDFRLAWWLGSGLGNDCYGGSHPLIKVVTIIFGPFSKPLHHVVMGQKAIWPVTAELADNRPDQSKRVK
jgi:hypothetical protein